MFHGLWHGVMKAAYSGPEKNQVQGHDNLGKEFVPLHNYSELFMFTGDTERQSFTRN